MLALEVTLSFTPAHRCTEAFLSSISYTPEVAEPLRSSTNDRYAKRPSVYIPSLPTFHRVAELWLCLWLTTLTRYLTLAIIDFEIVTIKQTITTATS
jgi:hypothetical protein